MTLAPMSANGFARVVLLWGPLGCVSAVLANEVMQPDIEFLEYLGSWEDSDADWLLFNEETDQKVVVDDSKQIDSAKQGKESTESRDES